jgi:hypothetical protein
MWSEDLYALTFVTAFVAVLLVTALILMGQVIL